MRTILIPTDFSESSIDAIKYAIYFAEKTERKLSFFHSAFLLIPTRSPTWVYLKAVKAEKELKLKMLMEFIQKTYNSLKIKRDETNTKFLVKFGTSVVENIAETINEQFIDLIIMGTEGATGFRKFFIGSNAASVIEQSYCPILAIPHNYKFDGINSIAYACSDLNNLKKELKEIIRISQKLAASLVIFHIAANAKSLTENEKFKSEVFTKSLSRHFKFDKISLHVIDGGKNTLVDAIGKFLKDNNPSILAMTTRKRSFFEKIYDPSQTKEISYQLTVPLLALRIKETS